MKLHKSLTSVSFFFPKPLLTYSDRNFRKKLELIPGAKLENGEHQDIPNNVILGKIDPVVFINISRDVRGLIFLVHF